MLAQILPQLLTGTAGKHHVGHHQIDCALALFVNLHCLARIPGGQDFKPRALQNAASCLAHEGFVLYKEDGAPPWPIVCEYAGLKSHTILQFTLLTSLLIAIAWPRRVRGIAGARPNVSDDLESTSAQ
jgi:hypothetical protein